MVKTVASKPSNASKPSSASGGLDPFNLLLGRAIIDLDFQGRVLDPKKRLAALKEVGIARPTKVQLLALENAIQALRTMHGTFGEGIGAA